MANKFEEKKLLAEVLNELYDTVQRKEDDVHSDYKITGEEQAVDWRTGELQWEDEDKTIPKMKDKWETVAKADEDLTEYDKLRIKVYQYVKSQLEKMI